MIFELEYDSNNNPFAVFPDALDFQGEPARKDYGYPAYAMAKMLRNCYPDGRHFIRCFNQYEDSVTL